MIDVSVDNVDDVTKARPIWTSCLAPLALDDLDVLVAHTEAYVASNAPVSRHFGLTLLGAAHYRAGKYDVTAHHLNGANAAYPDNAPGPLA